MRAGEGTSVLIVEGLHTDSSHSFASQLNVDIASSLKADVIVVADASVPNAVADLRLNISQFKNEGCRVAGVIFNKAPEGFDVEEAKRCLGKTRIWGVIRNNPVFRSPRTLDIAHHLNAEVVSAGEIATRRVHETLIAARSVAETIPRLRPGTLIATSGDRDDIILASALAPAAASNSPDCSSPLDVDHAASHGTRRAGAQYRLADPAHGRRQLRHGRAHQQPARRRAA